MGKPQSPKVKKKGAKKLKEDSKDFIIQIRVNWEEKEKIKKKADKAGKNISAFIRDSAMRL